MKRLFAWAAITSALMFSSPASSRDWWSKFYQKDVGTSQNLLVVPTYNGSKFRALNIYMHVLSVGISQSDKLSLTMYLPLNKGPATASDSFQVNVPLRAYIDTVSVTHASWWQLLVNQSAGASEVEFLYKGPCSDTIRAQATSTMLSQLYFYGR